MSWPLIAPAPAPPPSGPPVLDADGGWSVTRHADVTAVLTDPECVVPAAPGGPPGTLAWLRGTVSRFSAPERHPARRALGVAALAALDPTELRTAAARLAETELRAERTEDRLAAGTGAEVRRAGDRLTLGPEAEADVEWTEVEQVADRSDGVARRVPLVVLTERLGLGDPAAAVPAVVAVAAAYHPDAEPAAVRRADRAVATLLAMSPPAPPEIIGNRLGLLVQTCEATAGLIRAAARHGRAVPASVRTEDLLAEVLRLDPPVRVTRRVATAALRLGGCALDPGSRLLLRFDAANRDPAVFDEPDRFRAGRPQRVLTFGAGPRGCPGERHALALAAGVVDVLRGRNPQSHPTRPR